MLRDMINDYKTRKGWKIQLTMPINFISLNILKKLILIQEPQYRNYDG